MIEELQIVGLNCNYKIAEHSDFVQVCCLSDKVYKLPNFCKERYKVNMVFSVICDCYGFK
jgi:hypothetical protein